MLRRIFVVEICILLLMLPESGLWANDANNLLTRLSGSQGKEKYEVSQQLVKLFEGTDDATALKYALIMEQTAKDMNDAQKLAEARLTAARLFLRSGLINQALDYSISSLKWLAMHGTSADIANAYLISGICMHALHNFSLAAEHYARALTHFEMTEDADGQAKTYIRITLLFEDLGDYSLMHTYALHALDVARDPEMKIHAYSKYALALARTDSVDKALQLLGRLSDSLQRIRDLKKLFIVHDIMNRVLIDNSRYEEARKLIEQDILPAEESAAYFYLGHLYTRLAHLYDLKGDLKKTIEYNNKALYYRELSTEVYPIASSLNNLAGNFMRLGQNHQAYSYLRRANQLAEKSGNIWILKNTYDGLAEYYLKTGNLDLLFQSQQRRNRVLDSIQNANALSQAKVLFSYMDAERQFGSLQPKALARNPSFWIIIGLLNFIWAAVIAFLVFRYRRKKLRFREALNESRVLSINLEKRIRDLSEKQQDSNLKLKALADNIPLGVGLVDIEENFKFVNPALCEMLGYTNKELTGKNLRDLMEPAEFERMPALTANRKKGSAETYTAILLKKDKTPLEVQVSATPYYDSNGLLAGTLGIIQDLTEHNQIMANLKEARDKALESERLKSNFLAVMSHEIRTPLNAILNGVELVFNNQLLEEDRAIMVHEIHKSARNLLEMWDNMILLSKLRSGLYVTNKQWIKPAQILQDKLEEFHGLIPSEKSGQIELTVTIVPEEAYEAFTDAEIVSRIIHCLLSNAIKFTEKGRIDLLMSFEDRGLSFVVEDSGIGISDKELNYIFSYFRQGDEGMTRTYGGAGIGLSIVKDLLDRVSGTIEIVSEPGKGARVSVIIPTPVRKARGGSSMQRTPLSQSEIDWSGKTILVAEDIESNFLLLDSVLKRYGARVIRAENGENAITLLQKHPETDLILMDIHMPGIGGLEATRQIRQFDPDIIIIAQTAYAMIHDRNEILSSGCTDYIAKPIRIPALVEMLNFYLKNKK